MFRQCSLLTPESECDGYRNEPNVQEGGGARHTGHSRVRVHGNARRIRSRLKPRKPFGGGFILKFARRVLSALPLFFVVLAPPSVVFVSFAVASNDRASSERGMHKECLLIRSFSRPLLVTRAMWCDLGWDTHAWHQVVTPACLDALARRADRLGTCFVVCVVGEQAPDRPGSLRKAEPHKQRETRSTRRTQATAHWNANPPTLRFHNKHTGRAACVAGKSGKNEESDRASRADSPGGLSPAKANLTT